MLVVGVGGAQVDFNWGIRLVASLVHIVGGGSFDILEGIARIVLNWFIWLLLIERLWFRLFLRFDRWISQTFHFGIVMAR